LPSATEHVPLKQESLSEPSEYVPLRLRPYDERLENYKIVWNRILSDVAYNISKRTLGLNSQFEKVKQKHK